jgi:PEGA domain
MTGSRIFVAATLALLVGISPADAQHRRAGRARGGAVVVGRAAPRGEVRVAPRVYSASRFYAAPRGPIRFYRPYYSFRPRLSLGFGLSLGYPVRYSSYYGYYDPFYSYPYYQSYPYGYAYPNPYAYPYPYSYPSAYPAYPPPVYPPTTYPPSTYPPSSYPPSAYPPGSTQPAYPQSGYPPQGSISPSQPSTGGMSFEIQPSDAQIYVDGRYVGTVGQFSPTSQPLGLTAGRHHVRITAPGYRAMEFDADIVSGEVLPYQGMLER